jgi:hypothetical protein
MPRFMLLLYANEKTAIAPGSPGWDGLMAEYAAFSKEVEDKGVYRAGDPLVDSPDAKTVRVRNGKAMVTAGPFAETAEQLGGYYMLECKTIEEAADFASRVPAAKTGSVEVREILDMG